jgi:uncharacterized membrane protein
MSSMSFKEIGLSAITMLTLDGLYIQTMKTQFTEQVMKVQGSPLVLKIFPTILCYILLVFGLNYFIISKKQTLYDAFLLGIVIYGVYDATTSALLTKWSPKLAIIDTFWGGILMTITTYITYRFA